MAHLNSAGTGHIQQQSKPDSKKEKKKKGQ
jgi:hypothetical protein